MCITYNMYCDLKGTVNLNYFMRERGSLIMVVPFVVYGWCNALFCLVVIKRGDVSVRLNRGNHTDREVDNYDDKPKIVLYSDKHFFPLSRVP